LHKKIDWPVVVALPWLPDMGHLDLGSRKELEFPGWLWDGEGVTVLVPNNMGATAALPARRMACQLPAAGSTILSYSVVIAASFPGMQIQGTLSKPELLAVPSE